MGGEFEFALEPGQALFDTGARVHQAALLHGTALHARLAVAAATRPLCIGDAEKCRAGGKKARNNGVLPIHGVLLS